MFVDDGNGSDQKTLAIWPADGARGGAVPVISPVSGKNHTEASRADGLKPSFPGDSVGNKRLIFTTSGLVGYPIRTPLGVNFTTLFNPSITYGAKVELHTSVKSASGMWKVTLLDHNLESQTPGGSWFPMSHAFRSGSSELDTRRSWARL